MQIGTSTEWTKQIAQFTDQIAQLTAEKETLAKINDELAEDKRVLTTRIRELILGCSAGESPTDVEVEGNPATPARSCRIPVLLPSPISPPSSLPPPVPPYPRPIQTRTNAREKAHAQTWFASIGAASSVRLSL